jgi:transcriptional regulator with XRE-family HTH domain
MVLTKEQNDRVRQELRRQMVESKYKTRFGFAHVLKVSPGQVSQFLNGKTGAGMKLLAAMSRWSGKPIDEILGKQQPDLAEKISSLEDALADEKNRNTELSKALAEVLKLVDEARRHRSTLRLWGA